MSRKCVIFGTSKIADVLYQTIMSDTKTDIQVVAFCVDKEYKTSDFKFELPVVDFENVQNNYPPSEYDMIIAIGYHDLNRIRKKKFGDSKNKGYELRGYIHSGVDITNDVKIGRNVVILNNVCVGPGSEIGDDTIAFPGSVISHHVIVGNHNWITSGTVIGGNTTVGDCNFFGIGCCIGHNIKIGNLNFVGTQAVITRNTEDYSVYIIPDTKKYRLDSEQFMKLFRFD